MVDFVDRDRAVELVCTKPVVFAEIMGEVMGAPNLEVHVMRPTGAGLHEVERDDTGPVPGETVHEHRGADCRGAWRPPRDHLPRRGPLAAVRRAI